MGSVQSNQSLVSFLCCLLGNRTRTGSRELACPQHDAKQLVCEA